MSKFRILFLILFVTISTKSYSQDSEKIPLTHDIYNSWKKLENQRISNDGKWISYEINPQKGDGKLIIYYIETGNTDTIQRGYESVFSPNSDFLAFKIKPYEDTVRALKLKKKKKDQLPKDSLGIKTAKQIIKIPNLITFKMPKDNVSWIGYLTDDKDTSKTKKDSSGTYKLTILNPTANKKYNFEGVSDFAVSKNGNSFAFVTYKNKNKIDSSGVYIFDTQKEKEINIFKKKGVIKKLTLDDKGEQTAFIQTADTSKVKRYGLYLSKEGNSKLIVDTATSGMLNNWEVSTYESIAFSEDGTKLFFQTAPKIMPEPKDTLLDEEKYRLDVWNWQDGLLQTQQNHNLEYEKKRTYSAVYNIPTQKMVQLADTIIQNIKLIKKGNDENVLGVTGVPYQKLASWEENESYDFYIINTLTGEKKLVGEKKKYYADISPDGKYFLWYEPNDSCYHTYSIKNNSEYVITKSIPVKLYDEEYDLPDDPTPYSIGGWTENDENILIYDRYDIWKVNPENLVSPENITKTGRDTKTIYRYVKLETDSAFVENKILLQTANESTTLEGFSTLDLATNAKQELISNDFTYWNPIKSKKSDVLIWQRLSYVEFPDLWVGNLDFTNAKKISYANPQQEKYLWGNVELFKWKDSSGADQKGLVYKPENFDPAKTYPMIIYYYEKYTDKIHNHYIPNPSRSVVNFPLYNSNGYVIFIPDITYKIGYPGKSAYNVIMSGTYALLDKGYIDKERMGLQGQSWGGYQTAYMVTQTNLFHAAEAGAPVANMTSAYGGIRWESGITREHQYEKGQSRIGGTLWEKFDLYVENSPLFFANKIETPLLIMANDNDGAVPWQQGIEYFTALRRLNKPVWMLTYNGEEHNLTKWPNRVDLAKRMMQFFDHYLKYEPMPVWMSEGIKAIDKSTKTGYEFSK
jgi:dipeptidyl aminopeptidase/acylaminoacyl peptidase